MSYRYRQLLPSRAAGACAHNTPLLGSATLGVEVTEPELAARCGLGNIDPQHLGRDPGTAAIEAALTWPPPPPAAILVTLRLDVDAAGAMAVLAMRTRGPKLSSDTLERVDLAGRADRFDHGLPWQPRAMPRSPADIDEVGVGPQGLGALLAGLASPATRLGEAVDIVAYWLETGEAPLHWLLRAESAAEALAAALADGRVDVRSAVEGRIAVVEGAVPGSLRLGYRLAPIVVAVQGEPHNRRITIAQHDARYVDLSQACDKLCAAEPGWGGSMTIVGSPQGVATKTTVARCVAVLQECGA